MLNDVSVDSLKVAMEAIVNKTNNELLKMSEESHELGMSYTSEI